MVVAYVIFGIVIAIGFFWCLDQVVTNWVATKQVRVAA